jgi:Flp pilus assembly protein TadG
MLTTEGRLAHCPANESLKHMAEIALKKEHTTDSGMRTRGQSMVEFALILPILLVFLLTAADFGRAFTAYLTVSGAASEGAAFASMSSANADNITAIQNAALNSVGTSRQIWGVTPSVAVANSAALVDGQGYRKVGVTVTYTFTPLFSVWPIPNSLPMTRTVEMRVLGS